MSTTPDTLVYMFAGFTVFWVVTFVYVMSLWLRTRGLQRDADVLEQLLSSEAEREEPQA